MAKNKRPAGAKAPEQEKKTEPLMYIGPTIPGVAIRNRVYAEIPESLTEAIGKIPEISNLLIPITDYPEAERMLSSGKGYAASAYKKVATTLKEGGNNQ